MRNGFWLGLVLLAVHLAVCGGIWLLAWAKVLEVEGYFAPVMLLVPLWGPLCVCCCSTLPTALQAGVCGNRHLKSCISTKKYTKVSLWRMTKARIWSFHWRKRCWLTVPRRNASSSSRC